MKFKYYILISRTNIPLYRYIIGVGRTSCLAARALLPALAALALLLLLTIPAPAPRSLTLEEPSTAYSTGDDETTVASSAAIAASSVDIATSSVVIAASSADIAANSAANTNTSKNVNGRLTEDLMVEGHKQAHPELCPSLGAKIKVLILVMSAPRNFAWRNAIRMSWGHFALRTDVALGFVLGEPVPAHRQQVDEEDALYGDIIEGNFVDTYQNLTLKTLSMLEWATEHCPRARTLLKVDDDVFVNVPLLVQFLDNRPEANNTIWGKVKQNALPKRDPESKYYLSPAQFPERVLPVFATGPAYLVTQDVVPKLRAAAAASEKYIYLEDVFFTGIIASRLNITRSDSPLFYNNSNRVNFGPCMLHNFIALHRVTPQGQIDLWMKLLNTKVKCYVPLRVIPLVCEQCSDA